jgi:cell division protein ZapB
MPSSSGKTMRQARDFVQIPLDFVQENQYINPPLQGVVRVSADLFEKLDNKISDLVARHSALKQEHQLLAEEHKRLLQEREALKGRIDAILSRLEGV